MIMTQDLYNYISHNGSTNETITLVIGYITKCKFFQPFELNELFDQLWVQFIVIRSAGSHNEHNPTQIYATNRAFGPNSSDFSTQESL